MAFSIAEAFVSIKPELDTKEFGREIDKGVDSASSSASGKGKAGGKKIGTALVGGFAAVFATGKALDLGKTVLNTGAQLEQIQMKAETVFGDSLGIVQEWASESAASMGITRSEATNLATSMGDLLIPMGFSRDAAAEMSTETMNLSGALSEWSNGQYTAAETGEILTKAMLGERDGLKALGISISADEVKRRAATVAQEEMGKSLDDLTDAELQQANALATQQLVMEKSTDAQDAYAEGSDSAARKQAEMGARIAELKEGLISGLFPAFQGTLNFIMDDLIPAFTSFTGFIERNKTVILGIAGVITAVFLPALIKMGVQSTISAAKQVAAWVMTQSAAAGAAIKAGAAFTMQIGQWVALGAKSMLAAGKVAAAWLLAMGPIPIIIAAVVGLVALIIANWDTIKKYLKAAFEWIKGVAEKVWNAISGFFTDTFNSIKDTITSVWDAIKGFLSSIWNGIKSVATTVFNAIKAYITTVFNVYKTIIVTVWNTIKAVVTNVLNGIRAVVRTVFNAIRSVITNVVNGIKNVVTSVFNRIKSTMSNAANTARNLVTTAFTGMKTAVTNAINLLMTVVTGIPGKIIGALGNVGSMLFDSGKQIIQGLINGIKNMAGNVKDAVKGVLSRARNLLPFSPAKEGPFAGKGWTLYSGQSISEALAEGIDDSGQKAVNAAAKLAGKTRGALEGDFETGVGVHSRAASRSVTNTVEITVNGTFDFTKPDEQRRVAETIRTHLIQLEREVA